MTSHLDNELGARSTNEVQESALAYAKRGWHVFPMNGIKDGKCTCGFEHDVKHDGTHPSGSYTHLSSTCDPAAIIKWIERWPNMNFGVATGRTTGVDDETMIVAEISAEPEQHEMAMAQLTAMIGNQFRICGQVLTPYGTRHVYIELPHQAVHNLSAIAGVKIYGKGESVMGAGSLHRSGIKYEWDEKQMQTTQVSKNSSNMQISLGSKATAAVNNAIADANPPASSTSDNNGLALALTACHATRQDLIALIAANRTIAAEYIEAGFKLCRIAIGSKGPQYKDWQKNPLTVNQVNHEGLGLNHALSGTCAIDLDNFESAVAWFDIRNIDLHALLAADDAVQIRSGRPGRGKLIYKLPQGINSLELVQVKNDDKTMLLEFRSASVKGCQDVLPPTIHPDTGKPYEWAGAGDFRNLPELPPSVLDLWQSMLVAKPVVNTEVKPTNDSMAYRIPEGSRNTTLFKLGGNMARLGLSPESIRAVLSIENQRQCTQPLPEHEVHSIAKSAATNSYGAKEAATVAAMATETVESVMELARKAIANNNEQANTFQAPPPPILPAVMRDIAKWSASMARTVQPAFDQCTALAACASVLARDFIGAGDLHSNLYTVAVGPTACGKENALSTVNKILDAYDPDRRAGKPASDAAVLTVMARNPASTFVIDELGEVLQGIFDKKAASFYARIGTVFMDLYTKGGELYKGTEYGLQEKKAGGRERKDIYSPCPSIFGATTATTLYAGLSNESISSGFLPRILVFRAPDTIPLPNITYAKTPMPESVNDWLSAIKARKDAHLKAIKVHGDLIGTADAQYLPINVPYSTVCQELVFRTQVEVVKRRNDSADELEGAMLSRLVENAGRVALTLSLAEDPLATEVQIEHFKAALAIVTTATETFMADIRANLFDSRYAEVETKVHSYVKSYFAEHSTHIGEGKLVDRCKSYGAMPLKDRDQVIKSLLAQGKITITDGRNRGTKAYLPRC